MGFIGKKLLRLITIMIIVSALTFFMLNLLPGDIAYLIAGDYANPEEIEDIRRNLGLDHHVFVRYGIWLQNIVKGDLGESYLTGESVTDGIKTRLPVSLELIAFSQILALLLACPAGIYCAYKNGTISDRLINALGFATLSIPGFVMALLSIYLFSLQLNWLPATGYIPLSNGLLANLRSFFLPALSIALIEWVVLMRIIRSDMITTLQQDYILLAKAKGLPPWKILLHHALRPSSLTLFTVVGLHMGRLIGEAVIIETIFALPGIGRLLVNAIYGRDYMMVQGCILVITVAYVIINSCVDILYSILDPRIRTKKANAV